MILSGGLRSLHRGTYFNHGCSHGHAALMNISLTDRLQRETNDRHIFHNSGQFKRLFQFPAEATVIVLRKRTIFKSFNDDDDPKGERREERSDSIPLLFFSSTTFL